MRSGKRVGLTASAVASVLVLAGCGSSGNGNLLTQGAATQLTAELQQASTALGQYNCQVAYTDLVHFKDDVNQLTGVNATLVKTLSDGASKLSTLANASCPAGAGADTTTHDSATTTTTQTSSSASSTSSSVTTTSPETTTTTTTSDQSSSSGGAAPTTASTPLSVTTPAVSTAGESTTSPESGGAGLNSTSGSGGTGVAGADGQ